MIINPNDRRIDHTADGILDTYPYDFAIIDADDILVLHDGIEITSGFDVTDEGNEAGGTIVYQTGFKPASGVHLTYMGKAPAEAPTRYVNVASLPLATIERDFARMAIQVQQIKEELNRCLKFAKGSLKGNIVVADPGNGEFLRFSSTDGDVDSAVPTPAGSIGVPIALADGGTGASYASRAALLNGLGTALWGNTITGTLDAWGVSGGVLQVPVPLTNNATVINNPLSGATTTGIRPGTEISLYFGSSVLLTHSGTFYLLGAQNYTSVVGSVSRFFYSGSGWVEQSRSSDPLVSIARPEATRLVFVSGTAIKLSPFKGRGISVKTAGGVWQIRDISSSGISSGNPTTASNFVNGVAAQTLAANTTYLVCVFDNAGTLTLDFRTTITHTQDTDTGVEIATGLPTRTVVGLVRTNATPNFQDDNTLRGVISWFNKRNVPILNSFSVDRNTNSTSYIEINTEIRANFVCWGDEACQIVISGGVFSGVVGQTCHTGIGIDSTTVAEDVIALHGQASNGNGNPALSLYKTLAEGFHFATLLGKSSSGAANANWGGTAGDDRTTLSVLIRG